MTEPTLRIEELFKLPVTRDIPPVVYFHEQSSGKLADEVREYIVTGGYPASDPRHARVPDGIHEQFVRLLDTLHRERTKPHGPALPASWISGFYGSGKSSFAKLFGLALDGARLPDGTPLADALLARDESPKAKELREAWARHLDGISPMSVVFDIGSAARDGEHIHAVVLREVQKRLGYCPTSDLVAEEELRLERDEEYDAFLACAEKTLKAPWSVMKTKEQADDHFAHVLSVMRPERYPTPTEWIRAHARRRGKGLPVQEAVELIESMLSIREPERTLFLVVDEVSQYVHDSQDRMLKLQSFVSALGERLKGRVWLLVTGQQKLEEAGASSVLDKLKDRFPHPLRVHLSATNIRDVVHRRLLAKHTDKEVALEALFQKHRAELKLYGLRCEEISAADFVEVYPMLPAHIDLILQITTQLRQRSSRMQGDSHAIRGLLQLLGEVFRRRDLAKEPVGTLLTIEDVYEVLHTALDSDVQATLAQIFQHCAGHEGLSPAPPPVRVNPPGPPTRDALVASLPARGAPAPLASAGHRGARDEIGAQVARAVAMLELVQDREGFATKAELVTQCLYRRLGQPNRVDEVSAALERLRQAGLLSLTEKHGYRIQSSSGQEWSKERSDLHASFELWSELAREALGEAIDIDRPRMGTRAFGLHTLYSDRSVTDHVLTKKSVNDAVITLDLRFVTSQEERLAADWAPRSSSDQLRDRILWVVGDPGPIEDVARALAKSNRMIAKYAPKRESLSDDKKRLLREEEALAEEHLAQLRSALGRAFHGGAVYFRGRTISPRDRGSSFNTALQDIASSLLPELYPHFADFAVTDTELAQLLARDLHGPSEKFLEKGLGILGRDAGKYEPTCAGAVPQRVLQVIQRDTGITGERLLKTFLAPPYGYAGDVVRACVAGLLRGGKVKLVTESAETITAVRDAGVEDLFRRDRDFKRAEIYPHVEPVTGRDRASICKLLETALSTGSARLTLERDNEHIADAVHAHFARERERLRELERRFDRLPGRPDLPPTLQRFGRALEACLSSRLTEPTVLAVKTHLDALRDGFEQSKMLLADLTDDSIAALGEAKTVLDHHLAQLAAVEGDADLADARQVLAQRLASERPWRDLGDVAPAIARIRQAYAAVRRDLLGTHEQAAEAARGRIKGRRGFTRLNPDQSHTVLRPIAEALFVTTDDAIAPDLATLHHTFPGRLNRAEEQADDLLERELERQEETPGAPIQYTKVPLELRGRELVTEAELDALLEEISERVRGEIKKGRRVRLT